jgi:hypothetical protein
MLTIPPAVRVCHTGAASAEHVCQWSDFAACGAALTRHLYLWDPAGSPASANYGAGYVPEVRQHSEMSQRTPREYHMSKFAVSKSFDISYVLCMLCLLLAGAVMPDHLSLVFSMLIGFCIRELTSFVSVYVPKTQKKQKKTLIKCRTIKGRRYRHRRMSPAAGVGKCKVARFSCQCFVWLR